MSVGEIEAFLAERTRPPWTFWKGFKSRFTGTVGNGAFRLWLNSRVGSVCADGTIVDSGDYRIVRCVVTRGHWVVAISLVLLIVIGFFGALFLGERPLVVIGIVAFYLAFDLLLLIPSLRISDQADAETIREILRPLGAVVSDARR